MGTKINLVARRRARAFALQAIYQWQLTQYDLGTITAQFLSQQEMVSVDTDFFHSLLEGVVHQSPALDIQINVLLDRSASAIHQVERAILRMGAYELSHCPEIPYKVVLNEAIELAKAFGSVEGHKYVNGILHQLAIVCRPHEH